MKIIDLRGDLESIVAQEFKSLHSGGGRSSIRGGQSAADAFASSCRVAAIISRVTNGSPVPTFPFVATAIMISSLRSLHNAKVPPHCHYTSSGCAAIAKIRIFPLFSYVPDSKYSLKHFFSTKLWRE